MKSVSLALASLALTLAVAPAQADPKSYCEAYARDAATHQLSGSSILTGIRKPVAPGSWQAAYDAALADCTATYAQKPATERKLRRIVTKQPPAAPVAATQDLKPGSQAWKDYCAKKYTSFDADTGQYTGMSGKKRPCVVTPN